MVTILYLTGRGADMKVYFTKDEEHLPYILASGVWHYYQFTEKVINQKRDQRIVDNYLNVQKVIKEIIEPAVKNPILGDQFVIEIENGELSKTLGEILYHYLHETKDILRTIDDPIITEKCLEDVEIIENRLITAIKRAS